MGSAMRLVILGAGGHGVVVAEAAALSGWIIEGFYDDDASAALGGGLRRLGSIGEYTLRGRTDCDAVLGMGLLDVRRRTLEMLRNVKRPGGNGSVCVGGVVVHPRAIVSERAMLGTGVFVGPGAVVNPRARVGAHAIVNSGAIVEHDCVVGINAHVAPGTVLCGGVRVGDCSLIGAGSRVIPGVKIGEGCTIGAGSVVVRDVADGATVMGNPARGKREKLAVA